MIRPVALILHLFLFTTVTLTAQNISPNDSIQELREIIVPYQASALSPVTYQDISGKELKLKSTGQEPSLLLSETPSITNYSDGGFTQGYSYIRLRGIDQTRINITLDGVPLNEPEDQGAYFSNFPDILNSISSMQIQRGVGTSKNGVASYAGSIQLFSPSLHDSANLSIGLTYGSYNSLRAYVEYNSGIKKNKGLYVRASQIYSDGYKYNSLNNSQSVFLSSVLSKRKHMLKLNILIGHQQNKLAWLGVADSLIARDPRTNANRNEKDQFVQGLFQGHHHWQPSKHHSLKSAVFYSVLDGGYDFNLNSFLGLPDNGELYHYAFRSHFVGGFTNYTFQRKNYQLATGIYGSFYARNHTGSERTLGQLYQNTGYRFEFSSFCKFSYTFRWLNINVDMQYRYTAFSYNGNVTMPTLNWHFFNPKVGISFQPAKVVVIYYSFGRTGREPTRNDIFGGSDDLLADSSGQPLLFIRTPEFVLDHELGVRIHKKMWKLSFNLYYLDFTNEIVLNGKFGPNGLALTNEVDRSYRTGVELSVYYTPVQGLSLTNSSSFNYSRITEQQESFTPILTPLFITNQEINYRFKGFSAAITARYQSSSYMDFANSAALDGYFLLNTRLGYNAGPMQFMIFVNNITNTQYFNNGYVDFDDTRKYFSQAPTNFSISIIYSPK